MNYFVLKLYMTPRELNEVLNKLDGYLYSVIKEKLEIHKRHIKGL